MPYCSKCGTLLKDGAKFCHQCGAPSTVPSKPQTPVINTPTSDTPAFVNAPVSSGMDFSKVTIRACCANGHAFDCMQDVSVCPNCGAPVQDGGYIQLYRKGNYIGCAVGMGIYVDSIPYGHIANKQSLRIKVPFGAHKIHVTHTTTRSCNDPVITVTPENPHVFYKAHFSKAGFAIAVEPALPEEMPTR